MTTGRINQVTAEDTAQQSELPSAVEASLVWLEHCFRICLWSRMRPRMGFALVRTSLCVSVCAPVSKAAIGEAPLITCLVAPVQL